jgi:L-rhamnose mutarotase
MSLTRQELKRACFVLKVKSDLLSDFLEAHQRVWPEYLSAFYEAGIEHYTSFVSDDGLFVGYVESTDPARALSRLAETDVDKRWQQSMAHFWEPRPGATGAPGLALIREAFDLNASVNTPISHVD